MKNDDRISEVYKGEIWSDEAQDRARRRINWMVTEARGDRILDVGCSQGIATILLGREGARVTGIDIQESRIDYARQDLAGESPQTQERVDFIHGDVMDAGFEDDTFDTVLLGEVLEHLVAPERLLAEVARITKPSGRVVITTPFGHLHHHDHKQTFFPRDLLDLLYRHLGVVSASIEDRYFRVVATPRGDTPGRGDIEAALLDLADAAVGDIQRELADARTRVLRMERDVSATNEDVTRLTEELAESRSKSADLELRIERLKAEIADLRTELANSRSASREATRQMAQLRRQSDKFQRAASRQREKAAALEQRVWKLDSELALTKWKLQSMRARKWWRLGGAIGRARRQPWKVGEVFGVLLGQSSMPPRPEAKPRPTIKAPAAPVSAPFEASVPPAPIPKRLIPVAILADAALSEALQFEVQTSAISVAGWQRALELDRPWLLVVAGEGVETLMAAPETTRHELLEAFRAADVPTVLWDTDHRFPDEVRIDFARAFDFLFAASPSVAGAYRRVLGEDQVELATLGIAPEMHNPTSSGERLGKVAALAESFRGEHRPGFDTLVELANDVGLDILSSQVVHEDVPPAVIGESRIVDDPVAVLKGYRVALAGGEDTGDVVSKDILTIAATNTPLVIPVNHAATELFGSSVLQPATDREVARSYRALLRSDAMRARHSHVALRQVMRHHKIGDRVDSILNRAGLAEGPRDLQPISVVVPTNRPEQLEHLLGSVGKQSYPSLELVLVLHGIEIDDAEIKDKADAAGVGTVNVVRVSSDVVLGDVINRGFAEASHRLAAKMDDDDFYGTEYMSDLADALEFSGADIVGKWAHFAYVEDANSMILRYGEHEHVYREVLAISTLLLDTSIFETVKFPSMPVGSGSVFLKAAAAEGARAYSADRFNYVYMRYSAAGHHTFPISDLHLTSAELVCHGLNLDHVMV